jgi:hypothetical protein
MEIRSKHTAMAPEAPEVSEADVALINERFALRPVEAGDLYVRRLAVCNDQYDRTHERFPRAYLERFAATLPGKSLLAHHDQRRFPLGRFFKAQVETAPPTAPGEPPVTWLYAWAYVIKTPPNEEVRRQIDGGVFSHVSIGFRWSDLLCDLCGRSAGHAECGHEPGQAYDGRRCTATYGGDLEQVEAVEASLVYLGAQYGAAVTKALPLAAEPEEAALAADGREYRAELRREILRLATCVGADSEAAMLLEALGEPPAARLREVLHGYAVRFDALYPLEFTPATPAPLPAPEPAPGAPLEAPPQGFRLRK